VVLVVLGQTHRARVEREREDREEEREEPSRPREAIKRRGEPRPIRTVRCSAGFVAAAEVA
ncbi:MAG: hypothetical protein ACYS9X_29070, partial [Planctomycetota bacterium]